MANNILLGVSGGIAAYKACAIVRAFKKRGDQVRVVMTDGAREFIQPLTLQVLSENPVGTTTFDPSYEYEIGHIELARWADVVLLAPATANLIARMAAGLGDDLLTTVLLATTAPVVVAPAMNTQMWGHQRVQANLEVLSTMARHVVVEPDSGELACNEVGPGRLPDPEVLVQEIDRVLSVPILADKKVVLTAGPTREFIDPARFISNPSSGKMGHALARAAREKGADVTLIRGPVALDAPRGVEIVEVTSARQMHKAVMERAKGADFVAMVAAVADWRPQDRKDGKVKKEKMSNAMALTRNPDILKELGQQYGPKGNGQGPTLVGFAAESDDVVARATHKMKQKGAHMMVANQIGGPDSAFGADRVEVSVIAGDRISRHGPAPKLEVARQLWERAADLDSAR